jgi:hypothetical protein
MTTWWAVEERAEAVDDPVGGRLGDSEERGELAHRQVRAPVRRDEQDAVLQRQPQGRPRCTSATVSRRTAVTGLPKQRGLSPVNGVVQDGSDAVITPATPRSSRP